MKFPSPDKPGGIKLYLDELMLDIKAANKDIAHARQKRDNVEKELFTYLGVTYDIDNVWVPYIHACPSSPIGTCVYNSWDTDDCVFCHEPYERK